MCGFNESLHFAYFQSKLIIFVNNFNRKTSKFIIISNLLLTTSKTLLVKQNPQSTVTITNGHLSSFLIKHDKFSSKMDAKHRRTHTHTR